MKWNYNNATNLWYKWHKTICFHTHYERTPKGNMKYKITIIVEGGNELEHALEKGYVEMGIQKDVFPDEEILEFQFEKIIS